MNQRPSNPSNFNDVRMRGFTHRSRVADVLAWLQEQVTPLPPETISLSESAGRVLAEDVISRADVPGFARAMMDGYALLGSDTEGASTYNRLPLEVIGESLPGRRSDQTVTSGKAIRIMTGAPMPEGADAVLPAEYVQVESNGILLSDQTSPGKHVGFPGEDIAAGTRVLKSGRLLRPQDVGVLASIGVGQVRAIRVPRVRIVVTGNELLPPGSQPEGFRIVDSNSPMLAALIRRDGGTVDNPGIVADDPDAILAAFRDDVDIVLVSGGTSVGQEDHAPRILAEQGELAFHGIAMRPSSPSGMGWLEKRLVFLLPGNPVSCLCAYDFFAGRAIRAMGGRSWEWPYRTVRRRLARKLGSTIGRVDYARVRIVEDLVEPLAISGASLLSSTTRADGFVIVSEGSEGFAEETEVDVHLYDL